MRFTKDIEYALMACAALANQQKPLSAKEIAKQYKIPFELLSKILQNLSAQDSLRSVKGPKGGYVLNKSPEDISIGDVVVGLRGSNSIIDCTAKDSSLCSRSSTCVISSGMNKLQKKWDDLLFSISVKDFLENGK